MRMGIPGAIVFWSVLAVAIISAGRLARSRDREFAALGALVAAAVVGYAFEGAVDQGFFFYRIAFVVGTLLGLLHAARRLDAEREEVRRLVQETALIPTSVRRDRSSPESRAEPGASSPPRADRRASSRETSRFAP